MSVPSPRKVISKVSQAQYGLLRSLTDAAALDAAGLEAHVVAVTEDRLALADGMLQAAQVLAARPEPLVRRSAVSRAYYGAYHAARATVFAVRKRDEDNHEKLPSLLDELPGQQPEQLQGNRLTELRRLRNEMDYSPYPGVDPGTQFEPAEIDEQIHAAVAQAQEVVTALKQYLTGRE